MFRFIVVGWMLALSLSVSAGVDEGLVAYWDFDEGKGDVLHDRSGNNNHGKIHGAEWVKCGKGYALQFDGIDDYVDCGSGPSLDITGPITLEAWVYPETVPSGEPGIVGKFFESYMFTYYSDGRCWWYISSGSNHCGTALIPGSWHHIAGTFDGVAMRLYIDGDLTATRSSTFPSIKSGKKFFIGCILGNPNATDPAYTKIAHFQGMVDEVRVYCRALSDQEIAEDYVSKATQHPAQALAVKADHKAGQILLKCDLRNLGKSVREIAIAVLKPGEDRPLLEKTLGELSPTFKAETILAAQDLPSGDYEVRLVARDETGAQLGKTATDKFNWVRSEPGRRILNNLVTELLSVKPRRLAREREYRFTNFRDGWVFISSSVNVNEAGKARVRLDAGDEPIIIHEGGQPETAEAMRYLSAGEHRLKLQSEGRSAITHLVVRAIPELVYSQFAESPVLSGLRDVDATWGFMERHLLRNVNTIVAGRSQSVGEYLRYVEEWKRRGKRWIIKVHVPGVRGGAVTAAVTGEEAYEFWNQNPGLQMPLPDGLIVDEFWPGLPQEKYQGWNQAVKRIYEEHKGKLFYPYCVKMYGSDGSRELIRTVIASGNRFAWECYFLEAPSLEEANKLLDLRLGHEMRLWKNAFPNCERHMIVCFGYESAPTETFNSIPSVDYKVWMDMQFNYIANHPEFFGLYGVMEYKSGYADEEYVRWGGRLFRHYCIEGHRNMLSADPYVSNHIRNPDFEAGTKDWLIRAAEEGSVAAKRVKGYGWLQGRWTKSGLGDSCLWARRSAKRPNVLSQNITDLQPGRLYSIKMFTADYGEFVRGKSARQKHGIHINIQGAYMIPEKRIQHVFANCYDHHLGPFNDKNRFWMNYHRRIFRARARTATLEISDWTAENKPGGPVGQELIYNFIEVQPYLVD